MAKREAPLAAGMLLAICSFAASASAANLIASLYCAGMPNSSEVVSRSPFGSQRRKPPHQMRVAHAAAARRQRRNLRQDRHELRAP